MNRNLQQKRRKLGFSAMIEEYTLNEKLTIITEKTASSKLDLFRYYYPRCLTNRTEKAG